jgi:hypothetical protein
MRVDVQLKKSNQLPLVKISLGLLVLAFFGFTSCRDNPANVPDPASSAATSSNLVPTQQEKPPVDPKKIPKGIKALMYHLALSDAQDITSTEEYKKINQLTKEEQEGLALWYSVYLYKKSKPSDEKLEKKYNNYLAAIKELFKDRDVGKYIGISGYLTSAGVELLIGKIKDKDKYKNYFNSLEFVARSALKKFVDDLKVKGFLGKKVIIVSSDVHFTPIFMNFQATSVEAIISDSLGVVKNVPDYTTHLKDELLTSSLRNLKVYALSYNRQYDHQSSPVFALLDIMASNKVDLIDYVDQLELNKSDQIIEISSDPATGNSYAHIQSLPPHFMKATQSISKINAYLADQVAFAPVKIGKRGTLLESINAYTLPLKDGNPANFYARKKFFKYVSIIIHQIFKPASK